MTLAASTGGDYKLSCLGSDYVYGGGAWLQGGYTPVYSTLWEDSPSGDLHGWFAAASNNDAESLTLHVYALCAPAPIIYSV